MVRLNRCSSYPVHLFLLKTSVSEFVLIEGSICIYNLRDMIYLTVYRHYFFIHLKFRQWPGKYFNNLSASVTEKSISVYKITLTKLLTRFSIYILKDISFNSSKW